MTVPKQGFTLMAFGLNSIGDAGGTADPDEVTRQVREGTIFPWLEERFPDQNLWWSFYDAADRLVLTEWFETMFDVVDERRKFGVSRDGISILLAHCIEGIQRQLP